MAACTASSTARTASTCCATSAWRGAPKAQRRRGRRHPAAGRSRCGPSRPLAGKRASRQAGNEIAFGFVPNAQVGQPRRLLRQGACARGCHAPAPAAWHRGDEAPAIAASNTRCSSCTASAPCSAGNWRASASSVSRRQPLLVGAPAPGPAAARRPPGARTRARRCCAMRDHLHALGALARSVEFCLFTLLGPGEQFGPVARTVIPGTLCSLQHRPVGGYVRACLQAAAPEGQALRPSRRARSSAAGRLRSASRQGAAEPRPPPIAGLHGTSLAPRTRPPGRRTQTLPARCRPWHRAGPAGRPAKPGCPGSGGATGCAGGHIPERRALAGPVGVRRMAALPVLPIGSGLRGIARQHGRTRGGEDGFFFVPQAPGSACISANQRSTQAGGWGCAGLRSAGPSHPAPARRFRRRVVGVFRHLVDTAQRVLAQRA